MSTFRTSCRAIAAAVATGWLIQAAIADSDSLGEQFARIQKTIQANCGECDGATTDGFIVAVRALEALIAAGFDDPAAKKLLAQSYRTWAIVYSNGASGESETLLRKEQEIYATLVKHNSGDAKLWTAYAQSLNDPAKSLEALTRAEALAPEDAYVQAELGMLYANALKDPEKGVAHLERAVDLEATYAKVRYGQQLAFVLEAKGNKTGADEVRSKMKAFEKELEEQDRLKQRKE